MEKHVLGLVLPTDPRWVNIAEKNIREILVDHAYCEQKAASSCISMIIQFPEKEKLVAMMSAVVAEEWDHFQRVLEKLKQRGWALEPQRKDEYVEKVNQLIRKGGSREQQLVERLLLNALIEARSCERFRLLSRDIADTDLSVFYHELMISEAGHYRNFLSLAKEYDEGAAVEKRWREILAGEGEIMKHLEARPDRMH